MTYNNSGRAKKNPTRAYEMIYSIISDACRRFLEGSIHEHKAYQFYSGSQIVVWITKAQFLAIKQMLQNEGIEYDDHDIGDFVVNGKHLGEVWMTDVYGKRSCQLALSLSPAFVKKHSIVKRFAQLAATPLSPEIELHTCKCGFPMVKKIDGEWTCEDCWMAKEEQDIF